MPRIIAAGLGLLWFFQIGGERALRPVVTDWLTGDWLRNWLGFSYFMKEGWSFPIGSIPSLLSPVGTNIALTDSNPLMAILVKPFVWALPEEFQLVGWWLAFCFVMQGYFGAALASVVTKDAAHQVLGSYLFVLSPVLVARLNHDTLCAHWLLLAFLYLSLREYGDDATVRGGLRCALACVGVSVLINPYLTAMCLALLAGLLVRLRWTRLISLGRAASVAAVAGLILLTVAFLIGYFGGTRPGAGGFGMYSADLLTLINPAGFSSSLRAFPMKAPQGEGIGFLGLGSLLLVSCLVYVALRDRPRLPKTWWPSLVVIMVLAGFAFSDQVTYKGRVVLDLAWFYSPFEAITSAFRSSGRFIWPLHYFLLLAGIWAATRVRARSPATVGLAFLGVAVVIQAADIRVDRSWASRKNFRHASVRDFELARGEYRHLALVPARVAGVCGDEFDEHYVYRYMWLALRLGTTYNSGNVARSSEAQVRIACEELKADISAGRLDSRTIYVVSLPYLEGFRAAGGVCGRSDGEYICVSKDSNRGFQKYVSSDWQEK